MCTEKVAEAIRDKQTLLLSTVEIFQILLSAGKPGLFFMRSSGERITARIPGKFKSFRVFRCQKRLYFVKKVTTVEG